jgi:Flp pilus assembly pilin Flp
VPNLENGPPGSPGGPFSFSAPSGGDQRGHLKMFPAPRRRRWSRLENRQAGQGLVEYGLILTLVVIVAIAGLGFFGSAVSGLLSMIGTSV